MLITPAQCHAGRLLAQIEWDDLASKAGLPAKSIESFEIGSVLPGRDIEKLRHALDSLGINFIPGILPVALVFG